MRRTFWVLVAVVLATFVLTTGTAEAGNSITAPDTGFNVGQHTSLALDGSGYPVVSYYDVTNKDLKVVHCGNASCTLGNTINSPDTAGDVGQYSSLVLDSSGYPVVSYYDATNGALKVLHCNDANCAGGDDSIASIDWGGDIGQYSSLALTPDYGVPVISYYDATITGVAVLRCGNANCTGGYVSYSPDYADDVGKYTSLVLDGSIPVVSYYDVTNGNLKVVHCNDPDCFPGGDSVTAPDTAGNVGQYTSLALDGGNPVVSYYDVTNGNLKVMHCNDVNCAPGGDSITTPDPLSGDVGQHTSLALYGGNPVVSYYDASNGDLRVMRCNDANCAGANETITSPDTAGVVGPYTSLVLDGSNPVVSYYDYANGTLEVLDCNDANCAGGDDSIATADPGGPVGQYVSMVLDSGGRPVVSYYDSANQDLKVVHCGNADCTSGNTIASPDTGGNVGTHTSLALDDNGYPVVSYYDQTNGDLKVLHCGNADCTSGNSITNPDTGEVGPAGLYTSLVLDDDGYPVIVYYKTVAQQMRVLHCDDPNCSGDETGNITTHSGLPESGLSFSVLLDSSGYPVISYCSSHLKVMHCNDPDCAGGDETITDPDMGDVGTYNSLALDSNFYPVISYYDYQPMPAHQDLKVMHCNDVNCDPAVNGAESITSPDTAGNVGQYTSLLLDGSGYPVVSYYDLTNGNLKVLHCDDANCSGDESGNITSPDTPGNVGRYTSLPQRLDSRGNPVVAYQDVTHGDLKVLHCDNGNCAASPYPPAGTDQFVVQFSAAKIWLDGVDKGPFVASGNATVVRGDPYVDGGGKECVDYQIQSMHLEGTLNGVPVDIDAGAGLTVPGSEGTICEGDATLELYVEETDEGVGLGGSGFTLQQEGNHLCNCYDFVAERWSSISCTAVVSEVPPPQVSYYCGEEYWLCNCQTDEERARIGNPDSGGLLLTGVGGVAEWPGAAAGSDRSAGSSSGSGFNYAVLGGALAAAAAVVALAAGAWVARRRWVR